MRDLYGAHQDYIQEITKELLEQSCDSAASTDCCCGAAIHEAPLYLSTISSHLTVGFKVVPLEKRCNKIDYYAKSSGSGSGSDSSCQDLTDYIAEISNHQLDFHPHHHQSEFDNNKYTSMLIK
jgi:hypothetical protein